jgi:very-short-patch-repair endonuclease
MTNINNKFMDKKEYYIKQLSKTNKKNYENYVVCRIINLIDDLSLKFITQQLVAMRDGKKVLTDLYFPQIDLHIEVDEAFHENQINEDKMREADIVSATNHTIERIDVTKNIELIHTRIDKIIKKIKEAIKEKKKNNTFIPWNIEAESKSETYINRGYIDLDDKVAFKKIVDACNCFGFNYRGCQRAMPKHLVEKDKALWFPKLYENESWQNSITDDGKIITEKNKADNYGYIKEYLSSPKNSRKFPRKRIVFARVKDSLGGIMYRFKGLFKVNEEKSQNEQTIIYERIETRVKTYSSE